VLTDAEHGLPFSRQSGSRQENSISFYDPDTRIALFDAHPGNFFHSGGITIPIDGIIAEIAADSEHEWLLAHTEE
jgi:hypothetical protein